MNNQFLLRLFIQNLLILSAFCLQAQVNFLEIPYEELIAKAKQEKKPVLIFLSNNNNESWWMENNVFNNQAIGDFYNANFICGKYYGHINYTNLRSDKLGIKKYPFMIYLHAELEKGYEASGGLSEEQILNIGKSVDSEFKLLDVINHQINPNQNKKAAVYKIPDNDGRYTLGVRGKRLMYGYPYPNSTSHFTINVDGNMASNSPRFLIGSDLEITDYLEKKGFFGRMFQFLKGKKKKKKKFLIKAYDNVTYLNDTLMVSFDESNAMHSDITFRFNGLKITQKLSPLNEKLEACKAEDSTRYYQADYIIQNDTSVAVNAGLLVLFDTMIDNNDGATMDAFKTDLLEYLSPSQKKAASAMRGKYAKYLKTDGLKRILVYHSNKNLTKGLTGDFRFITEPDEIHIGPWPSFFSVLWDMPKDLKLGQWYYDSAVLLRWNQQRIPPGDKYYFSSIFGMYNKGILDLVPAGTNFTGTDTTGRRINNIAPYLEATPDTIFVGESTTLKWKVENPLNADVYISAKPKLKQRNQGSIQIKPQETTLYYLQMIENGKEIASANVKVEVLTKPVPKKIYFDGKFTIGTEKYPLIFGHPFPYSTSHFKLDYKGKSYSNNKSDEKSIYLAAWQLENAPENIKNTVNYDTTDFEMTQSLIPLDENFKVTTTEKATFFRCEYAIRNKGKSKEKFVMSQILDFSSLIVDSMFLKINGKASKFNRTFNGENIPKEMVIGGKSFEKIISLFLLPAGTQKPYSASVGDWQLLKNMDAKTPFPDTSFYQSPAALINWGKNIAPGETTKFAFIIGAKSKGKLSYYYNQAEEINSISVNFDTNKTKIQTTNEKEIIDFIKQNQFDFIVLEGFTDNRGSLLKNYQLAEKRIKAVELLIIKDAFVGKDKILKKVHGEIYSNLKSNYQDVDDIEERKVKITLYKMQK